MLPASGWVVVGIRSDLLTLGGVVVGVSRDFASLGGIVVGVAPAVRPWVGSSYGSDPIWRPCVGSSYGSEPIFLPCVGSNGRALVASRAPSGISGTGAGLFSPSWRSGPTCGAMASKTMRCLLVLSVGLMLRACRGPLVRACSAPGLARWRCLSFSIVEGAWPRVAALSGATGRRCLLSPQTGRR